MACTDVYIKGFNMGKWLTTVVLAHILNAGLAGTKAGWCYYDRLIVALPDMVYNPCLWRIFGFPMIKVLLIMPRVLLSCILLTIFPVNLSVDRGQSIKCVIFHPQFPSSLAYSKSRIAFSGSSSKAGIPWKSLKSALRKAIRLDGFECSLMRLKRSLKNFKYLAFEKSEILPFM